MQIGEIGKKGNCEIAVVGKFQIPFDLFVVTHCVIPFTQLSLTLPETSCLTIATSNFKNLTCQCSCFVIPLGQCNHNFKNNWFDTSNKKLYNSHLFEFGIFNFPIQNFVHAIFQCEVNFLPKDSIFGAKSMQKNKCKANPNKSAIFNFVSPKYCFSFANI